MYVLLSPCGLKATVFYEKTALADHLGIHVATVRRHLDKGSWERNDGTRIIAATYVPSRRGKMSKALKISFLQKKT